MRDFPIQTLDGADYSGPPGLEALLAETPPAYGTERTMPVYDGSTGTFVYCYTALNTVVVGGAVQINYTGSVLTSAYANPRVTLPDNTGSVPHQPGIACQTKTAAGGLWVQTKGRCFFARADGGTNIALGTHLTFTNGAQYLSTDHATVATVLGWAIFEGCRHGEVGATKWTDTAVDGTATYPFPSLADWPVYLVPETLAIADQGNGTIGDPSAVIYITGIVPTF